MNGVPGFVPASVSTTEPSSTFSEGKNDRRRPMTARPPPARRGMLLTMMFSALFFSTGCSAFFVVRRVEGTTPEDRAGHGQLAWAALREKFKGSPREAIRAEHTKMNNTPMRSGQDRDGYLYIIDSCRNRLNACDPAEGPTGRQYEDIILQALPLEYEVIC